MVLAPQPVQSTTGWPPQSQVDYPKGESIGGAPSCCTPKSQSVGGRTSDRSANRACNSKCPPHQFLFPEFGTVTCMGCCYCCETVCCGACCRSDTGECQEIQDWECAMVGGRFFGCGSRCVDYTPCPEGEPCSEDADCASLVTWWYVHPTADPIEGRSGPYASEAECQAAVAINCGPDDHAEDCTYAFWNPALTYDCCECFPDPQYFCCDGVCEPAECAPP